MYSRIDGNQVYVYAGFGLKFDEVIKQENQIKIKRISYHCNLCITIYQIPEPLEKLRTFHREFYPNHLITEGIEK